ncbi:hypothetical protein GQ53DRAFT_785224 [Thozetella sp. PMI_491]|nr:hypothetical protein GQ53DRAFT_785224 [Thozetella sp. PMI_491]
MARAASESPPPLAVDPVPYAVLSHCYEPGDILFVDLNSISAASSGKGIAKLRDACRVAKSWGLDWLWVDTVCTDRRSSAEQSEAVLASFRWLRDCQVCIVYLGDVSQAKEDVHGQLRLSRWMQRCWTLQELIAPQNVQFYDQQWTLIGTKKSLLPLLSEITSIDIAILEDAGSLPDFSVGQKMSWAACRKASTIEDQAYSLLGIFDVSMPVLYGEGPKAFIRLEEEIMKDTDDLTLLAWQANTSQQYRGLLATSPSEFAHFTALQATRPLRIRGPRKQEAENLRPTQGRLQDFR